MYKILGRITWQILKLIAPPLARKFQHRLTGTAPQKPSRLDRVKNLGRR
ncbi:hypothetical protein [Patulibacter minatonensis]|nr:hypothetical protein [Patulibacter minatonensis]